MTRFAWLCLAAVSVVTTAGAADTIEGNSDEPAVIKIDQLDGQVVRGQCASGYCDGSCNGACNGAVCSDGTCGHCCKCKGGNCSPPHGHFRSWLKGQSALHRARTQHSSSHFADYMRSKFGYFCPTGNCGKGMPLWGKYHMVYAAQPGYTDERDGYTYAAPGYGTPVNVPLAPNVRHSYNYGWGIPSSRLTPLRQGQVVGAPEPVVHHGPTWHD